MHGSRFRRFMHERLSLADSDHPQVKGRVEGPFDEMPDGLARLHWLRSRPPQRAPQPGSKFYQYVIGLPVQMDRSAEVRFVEMQLGIAILRTENSTATWKSDEFFVPPSLWGSGTGREFLRVLLDVLATAGIKEVVVKPSDAAAGRRSDFASRQEQNDMLAFYKGQQFFLSLSGRSMVRRL
jgi:hypothetical protein